MMLRAPRRVVALLLFVVAFEGCSTLPPVQPLASGAIAVPTDEYVLSSAESGILCTADAVIPSVVGVLAGDPSDPAWPVWLRAPDGHPMYVRWPRGFSVRFDPTATLLDENGSVFLSNGSPLSLWQVVADPSGGTKDHPYIVGGLIGTGLGQEEHCYTRPG